MKEGTETLASLGEFRLIRDFFAPLQTGEAPGVVLGIGDDGAVLTVPRTQQMVTTVDSLVEGIHFDAASDPFLLGQKALLVNLSDIAAMGGKPCWYFLSLALPPETRIAWIAEFVRGLREAGERHGVTVVGGNTTGSRGGIGIHVTLCGLVSQDRALTRSGSIPGDRILVSGTIGDAALALAVRQGRLTLPEGPDLAYLTDRLDRPEPRLALGLGFSDAAAVHALIDVSDGLVADLGHLCAAAGVGATIQAENIPFSPVARRLLERDPGLFAAMVTGGEDYELLCTAPAGALDLLAALARDAGVTLTEIGVMTEATEIEVTRAGKTLVFERGGWSHF
ncbi:MAG: thiamine-phosphate kinase [Magnetococcales bacterium]|nr:thiamine-phosphate kinase [Magnetococcales bacterium]